MVIKRKGIVLINSILILFIIITIAFSTSVLIIRRGKIMSENISKGTLYYENIELQDAITVVNNELIRIDKEKVLKDGFELKISDSKLVYVKKENNFRLDYKDKYFYTSRNLRYINGEACSCNIENCKVKKGDGVILLPSVEVKYEKINH